MSKQAQPLLDPSAKSSAGGALKPDNADGKYGDPHDHDPGFDGPLKPHQRKCTDVLFCLLFMVFLGGLGVVSYLGYQRGNPNLLIYGTDSFGNICGTNNVGKVPNGADMTGKPFLFFVDPATPAFMQLCVAACPTQTEGFEGCLTFLEQPINTNNVFCVPNYTNPTSPYPADISPPIFCPNFDATSNASCFWGYNSDPVLHRCVPVPGGNFTVGHVNQAISAGKDTGRLLLQDVEVARYYILMGMGIALFLGFVWLVLLRHFAGCMVWVTIFVLIGILAGGTAVLFVLTKSTQTAYQNNVTQGIATSQEYYNLQTMKGLTIAGAVVTALAILVTLFMCSRIRLAVVVIEEASKAMQSLPLLIFLPLFFIIIMAIFMVYWLAAWVYLGSAVTAVGFTPSGRFLGYQYDDTVRMLQIYHVFGLFWVSQFLAAVCETSIAGAIATWYFAHDKKQLGHVPILHAFQRACRFHLGSLALGSFVIAFVQLIRFMLMQAERALKGKTNKLVTFLLKCMQCCFLCLEKILKFISRNAYIQIAIYGEPFCTAAKNSFQILMRNAMRLAAVQIIGDIMLFMGKVFMATAASLTVFFVIRNNAEIQYPLFVCGVVFVLAYVIAALFMSVYEMAINTIFLCFCEDCERNADRDSYWMSDDLLRLAKQVEGKNGSKVVSS